MMSVKLSVVVPVYNSSIIIPLLLEAIDIEKKKNNWELELILIDDGSIDKSFDKIKELSKKYNYIKGIKLSRNFGHQLAVRTGLSFAKNDYIAIIDDDLQDPPFLIQQFINKMNQGFDVAYGVRKKRKENFIKKTAYHLFYRILNKIADINIPLDTGDFCVMKKQVVSEMLRFDEKNVYLRGIRAWVGFKQIGIEYERNARDIGESGYSIKKLLKIAKDGIFSFSNVPLRLITISGQIGLIAAITYSLYVIYLNLVNNIPVRGFSTITILISFFSSLILICLGIIGEYITRIYDEVRNRPHAVIASKIGFNE
jgi:glycosyltransferase involved in cell wall biosynthesis